MPVLTPLGPAERVTPATTTATYPFYPFTAPVYLRDGSDRYVIIYTRQDSQSERSTFARIFEADGTPVGSAFAVTGGRPIALPNGDFVLFETISSQVHAVRYTSDGVLVQDLPLGIANVSDAETLTDGGYVVIGETSGRVVSPSNVPGAVFSLLPISNLINPRADVAPLPDGGFVVIRPVSGGTGNPPSYVGQIFSSTGGPVGGQFTIGSAGTGSGTFFLEAALLQDGRFVVAYVDRDNPQTLVFARIYTAAGQPDGSPILVDSVAAGAGGLFGAVAALPGGGFLVGYSQQISETSSPFVLQAFNANGVAVGETVVAGETAIALPESFVVAPDGNVVVAFSGGRQADTNFYDVFVRRFAFDGGNTDPAAQIDQATTSEAAVVTGNVLANDTGLALSVIAVNGNAASVGQQIALESGALVTVNANGSFSYDPNEAFDYLPGGTGSGSRALETFTYAISGGDSTSVRITINGVASPGDMYRGTAGNDTIAGDGAATLFDLSQGGDDTATGTAADEGFFFGTALTGADRVNGGAGNNDQIGLQGSYGLLQIGFSGQISGVEVLALLSSSDARFGADTTPNSYNVQTFDSVVAAGATLTVNGNGLQVGENLTFNGSEETNGMFTIYGGFGTETLTGGRQSDGFFFGDGRFAVTDRVNGGLGADDQLGLRGNYSAGLTFQSTTMTNIETIALISSGDARYGSPGDVAYSYNLALNGANVAANATLVVTALGLETDEALIFNGAAETNGFFDLRGGAGVDTLTGGALRDLLWGNLGADTLTGGAGNDVYVYRAAAESIGTNRDTLVGFAAGDMIDLSVIDGIAGTPGSAFHFAASGAFVNGDAGQLTLTQMGPDWLLQGDTDGDTLADFAVLIQVQGGYTPLQSDVVL